VCETETVSAIGNPSSIDDFTTIPHARRDGHYYYYALKIRVVPYGFRPVRDDCFGAQLTYTSFSRHGPGVGVMKKLREKCALMFFEYTLCSNDAYSSSTL